MKIQALHIYGYGKFINQIFHLSSSNLHLIYGLNEAGKTTLMSFIESVLFGFPKTKRYEPKTGGTYGGMLEVHHHEFGHLRIERTAGKPERVNIYLENGSIRSEDFLNKLLSNMDRPLYKAIYSFDVFGLQEIHKMNRDKIGRFLLFSSLFGSDAISKMDANLLKKQEELFKPNGRKPELNQELERLKRLSEELKKAKAREGEYHHLLSEKKATKVMINKHEQLLRELTGELEQLKQALQIYPLIAEERVLTNELKTCQSHFPEAGLFELEKYESHLHPKLAQLKGLEEKKSDLMKQSAELTPQKGHLQYEVKIEELLAEYPFYQSYKEKIMMLTEQLVQLENRAKEGMARLKIDNETEILKVDITYEYEWKLQETIQIYLQLCEKKRMLDEHFERARADLEEAEQACTSLAEKVMAEDVRQQKEEALSRFKVTNGPLGRREELKRQLSFLKKEQKERTKRRNIGAVLTILTAFVACIAALFFKEWLLLLLIVPISIVFVLFFLKKSEPSSVMMFIENQLDNIEDSAIEHGPEQTKLREELWQDEQSRQFLMMKRAELKQRETDYERAIKKYEDWEAEIHPYQQRADDYVKELNLAIEPSFLLDAYSLIKELNKDLTKKWEVKKELNHFQEKSASFEKRLMNIASSLHHSEESIPDLMYSLKNELDAEKQRLRKEQELNMSIDHTLEKIKELTREADYFKSKISDLFAKAGASDREMFIKLANQDRTNKDLKAKLNQIQRELRTKDEIAITLASENSFTGLEEHLSNVNEQKAFTEQQLIEEREKVALFTAEQRRLEESGTVSELTHQLEMQKDQVAQAAKKWASIKLIRQAVKNKLDEHKRIRLPKLLETAESLLKTLTGDRYEKIYFSEISDSIMVLKKDGAAYHAHELSQATCEQLYLAIRFALALSHQKGVRLPFQLDDSFVHFDHDRFKRVLELLKELSGGDQQILYYTCHDHVKASFHDEEVTVLSSSLQEMVKKA
ncbi:ATP-binding protein [Bacillus changyiensis]|uniref:ATP-binding protein n=1 Tax=Bacillus changyiensis TaxID=3004103 RepID=UPI0022E18AB5|nr:AAA family ATPase [Bacillus changyiensis]MDA1476033.1 AAA family ATPase [Bacillus changyiensis]